ncbi:MAG: hypothetical protein C5B49_04095 [Bdellovibrio sp.]|nr:MAG: hypothetical protein C5B49_04095 [Bdellovibrio sp.]
MDFISNPFEQPKSERSVKPQTARGKPNLLVRIPPMTSLNCKPKTDLLAPGPPFFQPKTFVFFQM